LNSAVSRRAGGLQECVATSCVVCSIILVGSGDALSGWPRTFLSPARLRPPHVALDHCWARRKFLLAPGILIAAITALWSFLTSASVPFDGADVHGPDFLQTVCRQGAVRADPQGAFDWWSAYQRQTEFIFYNVTENLTFGGFSLPCRYSSPAQFRLRCVARSDRAFFLLCLFDVRGGRPGPTAGTELMLLVKRRRFRADSQGTVRMAERPPPC